MNEILVIGTFFLSPWIIMFSFIFLISFLLFGRKYRDIWRWSLSIGCRFLWYGGCLCRLPTICFLLVNRLKFDSYVAHVEYVQLFTRYVETQRTFINNHSTHVTITNHNNKDTKKQKAKICWCESDDVRKLCRPCRVCYDYSHGTLKLNERSWIITQHTLL